MNESLRRRYADYLPPEVRAQPIPPPVPEGKPRPGFGTIFILPGYPTGQPAPDSGWSAKWIDDFPEPGEHGEVVGIETFEGSPAEVLAWVRAQPAQTRLMPAEGDPNWVPLPEDDADVVP